MSQCWTFWIVAEVDGEVFIQREATLLSVHVHLYHRRPVPVTVQFKITPQLFVQLLMHKEFVSGEL